MIHLLPTGGSRPCDAVVCSRGSVFNELSARAGQCRPISLRDLQRITELKPEVSRRAVSPGSAGVLPARHAGETPALPGARWVPRVAACCRMPVGDQFCVSVARFYRFCLAELSC